MAEHCQRGSCALFHFMRIVVTVQGRHIFYILFLKEDFADNGYRRIYNEETITIEELEALKDAEKTIVDIRPQDQYMRGTFPGAVSLPASRLEEQYEEETARLDKMHPVYVMCHTGEKSQEWVRRLTGDGFDAVNVEGGYRAWLRLSCPAS